MNKSSASEYFKTFFITMLASAAFVIGIFLFLQHQLYEAPPEKPIKAESIDYSLINVLLAKNKTLAMEYPENYSFNLKLGILYEIKKDYKNAEFQYKLAVEKTPYYECKPQYKLACLYILLNRLDEAQALMDNLGERPDPKVIRYKADIFNRLGDKYYGQGDYENAAYKYEKSLFYYKIIKSTSEIKLLKGNLASAYLYLAEEEVHNLQIDDAIVDLKLANALINAPIIKYKLALLLVKNEPGLAYKYFDQVFNKAPELMHYEAYYSFLAYLAKEAQDQGNTTQAELFRYKAKRVKDYFKVNIITVDDIAIKDPNGMITTNFMKTKYKVKLDFVLENKTKNIMNSLFLQIDFKDMKGNLIDTYVQQIFDIKSFLEAGKDSPLINIQTSFVKTKEDRFPKKIVADLYVAKNNKSAKLRLSTISIKEEVKKHKPNKFVQNLCAFLSGLMAKFPPYLFKDIP